MGGEGAPVACVVGILGEFAFGAPVGFAYDCGSQSGGVGLGYVCDCGWTEGAGAGEGGGCYLGGGAGVGAAGFGFGAEVAEGGVDGWRLLDGDASGAAMSFCGFLVGFGGQNAEFGLGEPGVVFGLLAGSGGWGAA